MHYAAYNIKNSKVIQCLLTRMSLNSINKKDKWGYTPLDRAYDNTDYMYYDKNNSPIKQKIIKLIRSKGGKRKSEL